MIVICCSFHVSFVIIKTLKTDHKVRLNIRFSAVFFLKRKEIDLTYQNCGCANNDKKFTFSGLKNLYVLSIYLFPFIFAVFSVINLIVFQKLSFQVHVKKTIRANGSLWFLFDSFSKTFAKKEKQIIPGDVNWKLYGSFRNQSILT